MNEAQRARAEEVLRHIAEHPDHHDQGIFGRKRTCGTTACIAGWTVILAGVADWTPDGELEVKPGSVIPDTGEELSIYVDEAAIELLGLTQDAADSIFYTSEEDAAIDRLRRAMDNGGRLPDFE